MIETSRLTLIPSTAEMLRAEIGDHPELARILSASVPENWPPESTADALAFFLQCVESSPEQVGWFGWYALSKKTDESASELIGCGGFMGPPNDGAAQIGYSVIDQHQCNGFATEIVNALVKWGFAQPNCTRVIAETEWANPPSARVLEKTGFVSVGPTEAPGGTRFELVGSSQD